MELMSNKSFRGSLKRRGYNRIDSTTEKKNMKVVKIGGRMPKRAWRIRVVPKLRLKMGLSSPLKLWMKLKNGYINMMLNLAGNGTAFGDKRINIPKGSQPAIACTPTEFDNRLVFEIYKSLVTSRELATS